MNKESAQDAMAEMREVMREQIESLRNGESNPAVSNAMSNAVGKVISTYKLELQVAQMTGKKINADFLALDSQKKL